MSPRVLYLLVVIGVAVLGGGWYFGTATLPRQLVAVDAGALVFPDLAPRLKGAQRIEVTRDGKTLTIALKDGRWGVADRGNYPVIDTKLRGMLTALTELRLLEQRTADPERLKRLGVEDPAAPDAKSTLLRLLDAKGEPIVSLITGHRRVRTQAKVAEQIYVRRVGDPRAWLAEGALQVDTDPQLWLDRDVLNIDNKRVAQVIARVGGETLRLARRDDKLEVSEPADAPALDTYRVDDVARAFENLTFQDVQTHAAPVGEGLGEGVFTTTDGLTITASLFKAEKAVFARFTITGDDKAKDEATRLTARLSGWTYQLGEWKRANIAPTLADLKKTEDPPAQPTAEPPAAPSVQPAPPAAEQALPADQPASAPPAPAAEQAAPVASTPTAPTASPSAPAAEQAAPAASVPATPPALPSAPAAEQAAPALATEAPATPAAQPTEPPAAPAADAPKP